MSRLIDADELIKYIKIWEIGTSISSDQKEFIGCVNRQLTTFDVDKVVEQLEEELELAEEEKKRCVIENYLQYDFAKGYAMGVYNAIDIVKGGGVNDN